MTIGQMFEQSGILTLLGMATVFGFLIILVISITCVGKIIHTLGLDKEEPAGQKPKAQSKASSTAAVDATVAAVITSSVTEYRKTH
ncbi:MAG: OadG family protein [Treponema sp.]|jgi:oxaloacetate decarboxylase gamma subunit|nr:OadG family protein [Treponema sp.]